MKPKGYTIGTLRSFYITSLNQANNMSKALIRTKFGEFKQFCGPNKGQQMNILPYCCMLSWLILLYFFKRFKDKYKDNHK